MTVSAAELLGLARQMADRISDGDDITEADRRGQIAPLLHPSWTDAPPGFAARWLGILINAELLLRDGDKSDAPYVRRALWRLTHPWPSLPCRRCDRRMEVPPPAVGEGLCLRCLESEGLTP